MGEDTMMVELGEYELNLIRDAVQLAYSMYKFNNGPMSYSTLYTDLLGKVKRAIAEMESRRPDPT